MSELPPLDYETPRRSSKSFFGGWRTAVFAVVSLVLIVVVGDIVELNAHRPSKTVLCLMNLHQIGVVIRQYCNSNAGQYPDSFATMLATAPLKSSNIVCPKTGVGYVYLGEGLTANAVLPNQIIACEPLTNHGNGIDVLLGDGSTQFVNIARAKKIITNASAGNNPVLLPP